ncbi:MAG: hypothetical protein NWE93_12475, partial [Candidatus Bathyarchaeota archaeon]|nr:hypothetical protein [Candidatus Bathyarchaeota archaeon]
MTKKTRLIMSIIVLSILSSIVVTSIPSVKAAEPTSQQKTILTLENVLGVDLSHYNISTSLYSSDLYQGNLPQDTVYTILSSPSSNLDTRCTFVKGSLQMIYVSTNEGSPSAKLHGADTITMARDFLSNYQVQTGNSFYQELSSMIVKEDINTNTSKISQNIKLNITSVSEGMTFRWTYVCNGIEAPNKCVALRYENGFLKYFIDNWNLYPISNTKITLSESEAIEIAISKVKLYSPDSSQPGTIGGIKFNVTNGMIVEKLFAPSIYVDADKARGQDALELYPMYHVWVCLDKFYPGYVYGFNVYVWADTKEVCYIHQRISTMEPPTGLLPFAGNENASTEQPEALTSEGAFILALPLIALTVFTGVFLSSVSAYVLLEKKPFSFKGLTKLRRFKISRLLLCLLVLSPLLVTVISEPVMGATGGASVWGSESSASRNPPNTGESWRKSNDEVGAQQCLALYIASLFTNNSYNFPGPEIDNQGVQNSGSNKDAILSKITYLASNYPQMAVVDFDHGVGNIVNGEFHYMIEDQRGTFTTTTFHPEPADHPEYGVYDQEIYNHTTDNTFFAFINTCLSARIDQWVDTYHGIEYPVMGEGGFVNGTHAQGMPFAWMHKAVVSNPSANEMSSDGYHAYTKDNGPDCYIGFPMGSAALNETVENCGYQYWYWVSRFFYHALAEDNTIHNALDLATHDAFSGDTDFDESSLWNGFTSLWPTYRDGEWHNSTTGENSRMAVYGNADIKLYQPRVNFSAFCDTSGHENDVLYPQFTVGGETHYCGNQRLIGKTYSVSVESLHNYAFSYFSFNGQNYAQGNIPLTSDGNLVAHYTWDPVYYNLSISSSGSGSTSLSGVQSCL